MNHFRLVRACHLSEDRLEMAEGHGSIFRKDWRKPQLSPESGFYRLHYAGWSPRLYHVNFHPIIARRLRRSVLVMIIPLHIIFVRIISCRMIPAMGGERRV
jgi:hypothetical protein